MTIYLSEDDIQLIGTSLGHSALTIYHYIVKCYHYWFKSPIPKQLD